MRLAPTLFVLLAAALPSVAYAQIYMPMDGDSCQGSPAPSLTSLEAATACPNGTNRVLPLSVKEMLASHDFRQMHSLWHLVRDNWNDPSTIDASMKATLTKEGWAPPRLTGEPGSGRDFICMHHQMIHMVDAALAKANDPCYASVKGVDDKDLPWDPKNPDWPMPPWPKDSKDPVPDYKKPELTAKYKHLVETEYSQDSWLGKQTVDSLGLEFERGIHGWLHMHLSATGAGIPPDGMNCDGNTEPPCDWLGDPEDAHVNDAFWRVIHGWIEDKALRVVALSHPGVDPKAALDKECQGAFTGPPMMPMGSEGGLKGIHGGESDLDKVIDQLPQRRPPFVIIPPP